MSEKRRSKGNKRKPRRPYGYRVKTASGRVIERSLALPDSWPYEHRLSSLDSERGMRGAWVGAIDTYFPSSWLRGQVDGAHEIARAMCWDWPFSTLLIADVADAIVAIAGASEGHESVARRLQVHEQYLGALFEARVGRLLREAELPFRFSSSKGAAGGAADIIVGGPCPFVAEVKHVQSARRVGVIQALTSAVFPHLSALVPRGTHVLFDWSGEEVLGVELDSGQLTDSIASFAARAVDALARAGTRSPEQHYVVEVAGMGTIDVRPGGADSPSSISCESIYPDGLNERRLAARIRRAGSQIGCEVGVVFLCSEPAVCCGDEAARAAEEVFRKEGAAYPHLAGAIVLVPSRARGFVERTWPVANPFASTRLSALPLPEARRRTERVRFDLPEHPYRYPPLV